MFLDFLRAGLAEREKRKLVWDPVDMTVLANEQVVDGRGWRSGAIVEQREMNQWVFKITKYSQELLDALDTLDRWPDKVRLMQRNWIGRSEGMLLRFALDQRDLDFVNKYGLGNTPVVCPPDVDPAAFVITDTAYDGDGRMINSRFLDGMTIEQAKDEVARRLEGEVRGNMPVGERQVNF